MMEPVEYISGFDWDDEFNEDDSSDDSGVDRRLAENAELANRIQEELRNVFSRSKLWQMEKLLGHGGYGVTVLLHYKDPLRLGRSQRAVLKRSLRTEEGAEEFDELFPEIAAYKNLRGNSHIARMLAYCEDVSKHRKSDPNKPLSAWDRFSEVFKNPLDIVFPILSPFIGPAILLEYLENGALTKVLEKLASLRIHLPNRVLWSFYFCLVRACVGMAYPQRTRSGSSLALEKMPRGDPRPYGLIHGDIAARNIMIGNRNPAVQEHRVVPELKLIDFGLAREAQPGSAIEGMLNNLFACGSMMLWLINRYDVELSQNRTVTFNGTLTYAVDILPTDAPNRFPHLDPELRDLLVEAMAVDQYRRPPLDVMLERTEAGMMKPASAYPGWEHEELDGPVTQLLQRLMYDA